MGCFGGEGGGSDYDTGDSDEFGDCVCLRCQRGVEEGVGYVHVADGGCIFGGVESDLAVWDRFP